MKLKLSEVARCLELPVDTVERWIRQGRLPIKKKGSDCIFQISVLEKWAEKHKLNFRVPGGGQEEARETVKENLLSAMTRGGIFHQVPGDDVRSVLEAATAVIPSLSAADRTEVFEKLLEREKLTSTGIGKGVAIPHPRVPLAGDERLPSITTCFLQNRIDYDAVDDMPVRILFVILAPTVQSHLNLLSRLSYCVREDSFVQFLMKAPDKDLLIERITEMEGLLESSESRVR